jgi:hypothetical protein
VKLKNKPMPPVIEKASWILGLNFSKHVAHGHFLSVTLLFISALQQGESTLPIQQDT